MPTPVVSPTPAVSQEQPPENRRSNDPIVTVVQPIRVVQPVQTVIVRIPEITRERTVIVTEPPKQHVEVPQEKPEVQSITALPEGKPEEKAAETVKPEDYSSEWKVIPPKPEEKASDTAKKRKVRYEGEGGRIHTESQIDEILDFYLMTGELPIYVSDRQRYDYRHHERLPERKELLEQRGVSIVSNVSGPARRAKNVIPIQGAKSQRKKRTGS